MSITSPLIDVFCQRDSIILIFRQEKRFYPLMTRSPERLFDPVFEHHRSCHAWYEELRASTSLSTDNLARNFAARTSLQFFPNSFRFGYPLTHFQ